MAALTENGIVQLRHERHLRNNSETDSARNDIQTKADIMALAQNITTLDAGIVARFAAVFSSLSDALQRRRVYRQTLRELNALTSRELNDLGMHRSMITRVAIEAAYGK